MKNFKELSMYKNFFDGILILVSHDKVNLKALNFLIIFIN